jgi:hypothetical protein
MRLKQVAVAFALIGAIGLVTAQADAQNRHKTISVSRDENGKTRTRIIIQKRSYLDPGTEPLPSERNTLDYAQTPTQRADSPLNNTAFGDRGTLPGPFTLPTAHNPWLEF